MARVNVATTPKIQVRKDYDIAIVGSGLVGASLAHALLPQGFRMVMIDKAPAPSFPEAAFSARAIALSAISLEYLKTMSILSKLETYLDPIHSIWVSEQGRFGLTRITAAQYGLAALGAVVEADILNYVLNKSLEESDNIALFRSSEIKILKRDGNAWQLTLAKGNMLKAALVVGADGRDSFVRVSQGVGVSSKEYASAAVIVNVALASSHQQKTFERFTAQGSLAMLPFGENRVKCVWVLPIAEAQSLCALSEAEFLQHLHQHFGCRLGKMTGIGKRVLLPLRQSLAEHFYGPGWVLIGNAAQTFHPVAAQGFNIGLRDAAWLAEELIRQKACQAPLEDINLLRRYAARRLADREQVRQLSDQLIEGSCQRRFGVLACEWFPPLHRKITRAGMGLQSNLPEPMWLGRKNVKLPVSG